VEGVIPTTVGEKFKKYKGWAAELLIYGMVHKKQPLAVFLYTMALAALFTVFLSMSASAVTSVPTRMNFQGKITDASGATLVNGSYNMRFKLYTASTGGTVQWSENRLVSAAAGVTVTNGIFSVQLGDVTTLPASLFNQADLYFEVELPTPATATSSSPSWTEGAMSPRNKLATTAYAYNSDTLDGIDSEAFAQLSAANTFTAANTYSNAVTINGSNGTKLLVQTSTNADLFKVDTAANTVTLGTATNGAVVSASGFQLNGTARNTKTVTLVPEYAGATFTGDGTNNTGSLSSDFCSSTALLNVNAAACNAASDEHNYYAWTTTQGTAQNYDIYVRYRIPSDYSTGSMANLKFWAWGSTSASEIASLGLYKNSGTACSSISNAVTANTTWAESTIASPLGACSIVAGDYITLKIKLTAGTNKIVRAGEINFTYRGSF